MKKGFFTFASFAAAALVWGTMASAADSVLLNPTPMTERANAQVVKQVADETTEVTAPQAVTETPEFYYYDDGASQFNFGGYIYASWYDGFYRWNDPSLAVNQTVLFAERKLDTYRNGGFDWGYNVTALFGTEHAQFADDGFDGKWGVRGDGYGMSIYEAYGSVGIDNLSVKFGKFASPFGYESAVGPVRDLNTTSYIHLHEPLIFSGALATWDVSERFSLNGGLTFGANNSWEADDNYGFIFGAKFQWTDRLAISYEGYLGRLVDEDYAKANQYLHSIIATWDIDCRTQYVFETCYGSVYDKEADELAGDFFGIANYLKYKVCDNIEAITRFEWARDKVGDEKIDHTELTFGVKYNVNEHLMIRPEVRYDWVKDGGAKDKGFSGGISGAFMF